VAGGTAAELYFAQSGLGFAVFEKARLERLDWQENQVSKCPEQWPLHDLIECWMLAREAPLNKKPMSKAPPQYLAPRRILTFALTAPLYAVFVLAELSYTYRFLQVKI
jgi:hypothetical protein